MINIVHNNWMKWIVCLHFSVESRHCSYTWGPGIQSRATHNVLGFGQGQACHQLGLTSAAHHGVHKAGQLLFNGGAEIGPVSRLRQAPRTETLTISDECAPLLARGASRAIKFSRIGLATPGVQGSSCQAPIHVVSAFFLQSCYCSSSPNTGKNLLAPTGGWRRDCRYHWRGFYRDHDREQLLSLP